MKHFRRAVTGTDADLRRLQLKDARKLLLKFNISDKIIQTLTRWEIVDLVRRQTKTKFFSNLFQIGSNFINTTSQRRK